MEYKPIPMQGIIGNNGLFSLNLGYRWGFIDNLVVHFIRRNLEI